ncbi:MAG: histidine phosphatase family protein [Alphaproteobacteria bacterium]|nr:histidine phosphatase family protein [Alphaproteobacteria bacterium]
MKNKIWLIRHAQSASNAGVRAHVLNSENPLSENGHAQAIDFAAEFLCKPDLIVTSSYLRTRQSAAPLIEKFPDVPVEVWPIHEFDFMDPEKYAGTTFEERGIFRDEYLNRNDQDYKGKGAQESFNDLIQRVDEFLKRLKTRQEKFIVVFSHGWFIEVVKARAKGRKPNIRETFEARRDNLEILEFEI